MRILIVGAGLGGLSAAICFGQKGHDVEVLEQRDSLSPAGNGINIRPGASQILHTWGLRKDLERISENTPANCIRDLTTGAVATKTVAADISEHPDWGTHRAALVEILAQRAREAGARLTFGAEVVDVQDDDGAKVIVVLKTGAKIEADLLLAADGIRSRIRGIILSDVPTSIEPLVSDITLYGVVIPEQATIGVPELESLQQDVYLNVYMGQNAFVVGRYNRKLRSQGCLFGVKAQTQQKSLWDERGDLDYVRECFQSACPELRKVLEVATSCDRWKVAEMPDLPRWRSQGGRVVLLGDSAHAMHPNAAQGYSQIIEDIGVLEYLVSQDPDPSQNLATITSDWEEIRKPRVQQLKEWSRANSELYIRQPPKATEQPDKWHVKSLKDTKPDMDANMNSSAFLKWAQSHDAIAVAEDYVKSKRAKL